MEKEDRQDQRGKGSTENKLEESRERLHDEVVKAKLSVMAKKDKQEVIDALRDWLHG